MQVLITFNFNLFYLKTEKNIETNTNFDSPLGARVLLGVIIPSQTAQLRPTHPICLHPSY